RRRGKGQQHTPIPHPRPRTPCSFIGETRSEPADSEEAEVCRVFYRPRCFNARSQRAKKGDFLSERTSTLRAEGIRDISRLAACGLARCAGVWGPRLIPSS